MDRDTGAIGMDSGDTKVPARDPAGFGLVLISTLGLDLGWCSTNTVIVVGASDPNRGWMDTGRPWERPPPLTP